MVYTAGEIVNTNWTTVTTPIGELFIEGTDEVITRIWFEGEKVAATMNRGPTRNPLLVNARDQLKEYFAGLRGSFDFPLSAEGTEFQQAVWKALSRIRYGHTRTYGQLAADVKRPVSAARGVGQACGHNPLPIVVPCHRALGKNGNLTGFGGGVWRKEWLLLHEQAHTPEM